MAQFFWNLFFTTCKKDEDNFTEAHLGEDNSFYYNEELKQWVVRGEEDKVKETLDLPPPSASPKSVEDDTSCPSVPEPPQIDPALIKPPSYSLPSSSRRSLKSKDLYTNIPGLNIKDSATPGPTTSPFGNFPTQTQSQFVPTTTEELVNDDLYTNIAQESTPERKENL